MAAALEQSGNNLREFINLLSDLNGVVEVKVMTNNEEAWIGIRTGRSRSASILLHQLSRAALGFGLGKRTVHFGILAD